MSRTFFAALLTLVGLTSAAPAQMFYSGPTGYTSYYGPTYFHAPAYSPGYAASSYTAGYRGYGPLGILNPRTWFGGRRAYRSAAYTSPFYGSTYSAAYAPSYSYTAGYSPLLVDTTTSYYGGDALALASYETPLISTGSACCQPSCCPTSCCQPCGGCSSCASGNCPGGNCALNYAPAGDMTPKADPNMSGSSGSRTYQSESSGTTDGFRRSRENEAPNNGNRPDDGYNPDGSRRSGYRPAEQIQQKAPTKDPENTGAGNAATSDAAANNAASDAGSADEKTTDGPTVPADKEKETDAATPALNLDAKVAAGPSLLRERLRMQARFGSPQLARAKVDPATLPAAADLRLVQK